MDKIAQVGIVKIDNYQILMVQNVPQSAYPPPEWGYWKHMIPENFTGKEVLVLGVGAGTIPRLLLKSYPHLKIIGVDNNSLITTTASRQFKLDEIKMDIEIEDGFEYVRKTKKKFDLILVDMWNGYWFPFKVLSKEFIEDCKSKLNDNGEIYINTPNLDFLAQESLKGLTALRNDIGRNIIYQWKK